MVLSLLLSCSPNHVLAGELPGLPSWTADGLWYISQAHSAHYSWSDEVVDTAESSRALAEEAWVVHARPANGGQSLTWLASYTQHVPGESSLKGGLASHGDRKAMDAWLGQHPLGPPSQKGVRSPSGATAGVLIDGAPLAWNGTAFSTTRARDELEDVPATLTIQSGGHTWSRVSHTLEGMPTAFGAPEYFLVPIWSPTGARVLWRVYGSEIQTMRGPTGSEPVELFADANARLKLKASTDVMPHLPKIAGQLEAAGFPVNVAGVSMKERDKSVVYAPKGMEVQARAVAAAVPGGALIEALTWELAEDMVVALGSSAAPR